MKIGVTIVNGLELVVFFGKDLAVMLNHSHGLAAQVVGTDIARQIL